MKGQQPCIVWFTGLSGAGKSTIVILPLVPLLTATASVVPI